MFHAPAYLRAFAHAAPSSRSGLPSPAQHWFISPLTFGLVSCSQETDSICLFTIVSQCLAHNKHQKIPTQRKNCSSSPHGYRSLRHVPLLLCSLPSGVLPSTPNPTQWGPPLNSSSTLSPSPFQPTMLAALLLLTHTTLRRASGPLHLLFLLPGTPFSMAHSLAQ